MEDMAGSVDVGEEDAAAAPVLMTLEQSVTSSSSRSRFPVPDDSR
jgi:hypothetical protein